MRLEAKKTRFFGPISRRRIVSAILSLPLAGVAHGVRAQARFVGDVIAKFEGPRNMRLIQPFEFVDKTGRRWRVPVGTVIDGASIPQPFWSVIGGPFEGLYRAPSVVHDYFCEVRTRKAAEVHFVFYEAMLVAGVGQSLAWLMYKAVDTFGPTWPDPRVDPRCQIIDENYDFDFCAQNTVVPKAVLPPITRDRVRGFADTLEGQISAEDLAKVRQVAETL